jgi:hypothetical protein
MRAQLEFKSMIGALYTTDWLSRSISFVWDVLGYDRQRTERKIGER